MKNMIIKLDGYKKEQKRVGEELKTLPDGRLVKRGRTYTHVINKKKISITKNTELIRALYRKKFLLTREKQLNNNISAISHYIETFNDATANGLINSLPPTYQAASNEYFFHPSIDSWSADPSSKNPYKRSELVYTTKIGIKVRSKSEVSIANTLTEHNIPYRYEAPLKLGSKTIYPDFITLNPYTGQTTIWEHFGMIHESEYEQHMINRMNLYEQHSYIPFLTVIYTFEFDLRTDNRLQFLIENVILQG